MKHVATTVAGVFTILGSLFTFAGLWMKSGVPSAEAWSALGMGLAAGAGLIKAADANKVPPPEGPAP